jgi:hypothetical protein
VFEAILNRVKALYKTVPMVLFLEDEDIAEIIEVGRKEGWKMYNAAGVSACITESEGLILLQPLQCRGLNTPFKITSKVLIGCDVEDESEHVQMTGRSCRTRGINYSEYYFDKWQNEAAVRTHWKRKAFTKS